MSPNASYLDIIHPIHAALRKATQPWARSAGVEEKEHTMKYRILRACGIILAAVIILASTATAQTACKVVYTISPQNTSAFGAAITIQNTGTTAWTSWTLTWAFANGQTVSQLWNGIETQSGANVTVKNESYNGSIAAGGSLTGIGFNGTWNGTTNAVPASFAINGTACTVN